MHAFWGDFILDDGRPRQFGCFGGRRQPTCAGCSWEVRFNLTAATKGTGPATLSAFFAGPREVPRDPFRQVERDASMNGCWVILGTTRW